MIKKEISRQRRWQLKQRKLKRCVLCGKPAATGYVMCSLHVIKNRLRQRKIHGCKPKRTYHRGRPQKGATL